jgi:uncharacterized membrane protein YjfL (UPF0719 family)
MIGEITLESLIFLIIDAIIFNLYTKHKNIEKARINNSLYSNSHSTNSK